MSSGDDVRELKARGNALFREENYQGAADTFRRAIDIFEQVLVQHRSGAAFDGSNGSITLQSTLCAPCHVIDLHTVSLSSLVRH